MNVKEIITFVLIGVLAFAVIMFGSGIWRAVNKLGGFETRNTELERLNEELDFRNGELSVGLAAARADAERNAEQTADLRNEIRSITARSAKELISLNKITDRAKRIDALAGLINRTVEDIIKVNNFMEDVDTSSDFRNGD